MSRVLELTTSSGVSNTSLMFSIPVFNNIKIISPEVLSNELTPPYYGDTVTIAFWKKLHIKLGGKSSSPIYHLQSGYKYIYDSYKNTFTIINDVGNIVETIRNITSIGDMRIDFNIYKSHQLEISIAGLEETFPFYIPADLTWKTWESDEYTESYEGINDIYKVDINPDMPIYNTEREIHYIDKYLNYDNFYNDIGLKIHYDIDAYCYNLKLLGKSTINWDNISHYNELVNNEYSLSDGDIVWGAKGVTPGTVDPDNPPEVPDNPPGEPPLKRPKFVGTFLKVSLLLPCYTMSMYPELMPILLNTETINNRPVYEPWMIWGLYKFIWGKKNTDVTDDFVIPIFDLSPMWG